MKKAIEASPLPEDFEWSHQQAVKRYWGAHRKYRRHIMLTNPKLFRQYLLLMDPVITVADDVIFFECFSADESSYGCLSVNRTDGFGSDTASQYGTTNVDYSWDLYHHFQGLRSYRETRFEIDPGGFEVSVADEPGYREEKIDLPDSWLQGFLQIQSVMSMPMRRVTLSTEAVYSLLAFLKRNREKTGPRAIRFELLADKPPVMILEPWEKPIISYGACYHGPDCEPIRIWGRRRLMTLARALPLAESVDVYLLGTGLPSFWVVNMGEMHLTLGLSGWTTNDWTRVCALDMIAPPVEPAQDRINQAGNYLQRNKAATFKQIELTGSSRPAELAASLRHLAHTGQIIFDLPNQVYRWRQIMPHAVACLQTGPAHDEYNAARQLAAEQKIKNRQQEEIKPGLTLYRAEVDKISCDILMDADGAIRRGNCCCGYFRQYRLKNGPCRHMQAIRLALWTGDHKPDTTLEQWYNHLTTGQAAPETFLRRSAAGESG